LAFGPGVGLGCDETKRYYTLESTQDEETLADDVTETNGQDDDQETEAHDTIDNDGGVGDSEEDSGEGEEVSPDQEDFNRGGFNGKYIAFLFFTDTQHDYWTFNLDIQVNPETSEVSGSVFPEPGDIESPEFCEVLNISGEVYTQRYTGIDPIDIHQITFAVPISCPDDEIEADLLVSYALGLGEESDLEGSGKYGEFNTFIDDGATLCIDTSSGPSCSRGMVFLAIRFST